MTKAGAVSVETDTNTSPDLNLPENAFTGITWNNDKPLTADGSTWSDYCSTQPQCTW